MMPQGKPKESFLLAIDDIESFIENPALFDALFEPQIAVTPARKKATPKAKKSDIDLDFDSLRDSDNSVTSPVSIKKTTPARKSSGTANIRRSLTRPAVPAVAEKTPKSILTVKRKATIENEPHEADSSVRSPAEKRARPIIDPEPIIPTEEESEDLYNMEFDLESNSAKSKVVPSQLTFGFLGLGVMGSRIVKRLLEYGHAVIVWNRTSEKCHGFQNLGAIQVFSPAEVLEQAHITFSCVSDPAASKEVRILNHI